jgi:hypothetical protein
MMNDDSIVVLSKFQVEYDEFEVRAVRYKIPHFVNNRLRDKMSVERIDFFIAVNLLLASSRKSSRFFHNNTSPTKASQ